MPSNHTPSTHADQNPAWKVVAEFSLPSQPGSDPLAWAQLITAVRGLNLSPANLDRLKTAIAKATLNAIEHGSPHQPELSVFIRILALEQVETGQGLGTIFDLQTPDPTAKGSGQRLGQAWGFFLIHKVKGEGDVQAEAARHTLELFLYREGDLR
ncbi:MAG: hypothetical protein BroJett011_22460 [Chloroflexota bacterium]|nr:MAG: hypothetical protein BroJett011_22460 [Chloroflexota bacterium]